jgi:Protein of unknown function (DUF4236)
MQFRKTKTFGPFRFTLTQRGISVSAGAGPLRFTVRRTLRLPGTGLWDTKVIRRQR